jgi:YggT family protein
VGALWISSRYDLAAGLRFNVAPLNCDRPLKKDANMIIIYDALQLILGVVYAVMIVHIIMSWLINFQVLNLHQPLVSQIWYGLNRLLEPLYNRIRRFLPDTGTLDLAPLVALLIVILLTNSVLPTIFGLR